MNTDKLLILGVTGSGKGRLAFDLAGAIDAEIISVDSMKVYRRMDIGTAKPPKDARERIKYHLIDVVEPSEGFSVGSFVEMAYEAVEQIKRRKKKIIAVGGTALYIKALLYGLFDGPGADEQIRAELRARAEGEGLKGLYNELSRIDPLVAERISPNDGRRIIRALEVYRITGRPISTFQKQWAEDRGHKTEDRGRKGHNWSIMGLRREKSEENKRINARVKRMIGEGFVDEVKSLLSEEKPLSKQAHCAIGYAEIIDHLNGGLNLEDAIELIKKNTRRLAKGQRTWFKAFKNVNWLDVEAEESAEEIFKRAKTMLGSIE